MWRTENSLRCQSSGAIQCGFLFVCFWEEISLFWSLLIRLGCWTREPQGLSCLYLPSVEPQGCHTTMPSAGLQASSHHYAHAGLQAHTIMPSIFYVGFLMIELGIDDEPNWAWWLTLPPGKTLRGHSRQACICNLRGLYPGYCLMIHCHEKAPCPVLVLKSLKQGLKVALLERWGHRSYQHNWHSLIINPGKPFLKQWMPRPRLRWRHRYTNSTMKKSIGWRKAEAVGDHHVKWNKPNSER